MHQETLAAGGGVAMDALTFPAGLPDPADAFLDPLSDLAVPPELDLDLDLDLDFEFDPNFSLDDLLDFGDVEGDPFFSGSDCPQQANASGCGHSGGSPPQTIISSEFISGVSPQQVTGSNECGPGVSPPQTTGSNGLGSDVSSSSRSPGNTGARGFESANSAACSADSGRYATGSPDSGNSVTKAAVAEDVKGSGIKRKSGRDEDHIDGNHSSAGKLPRRSQPGEDVTSSSPPVPGTEEEDKRKARLMRNRESAQLSRQRKKHYVEELEKKVKVMNSTIADLNNRISYFMAENATLKQQLSSRNSGNSASPPTTAMYPAAPMQYPWMPWPGYTMTPGSQVPLVPIPKLKTQQPISTAKPRGRKKGIDSKTKKVAGVSLVGLLFFMLVLGAFVPSINIRNRGSVSTAHKYSKSGVPGQHGDKVLAVTGKSENSRFCRGGSNCDGTDGYPSYVKGTGTELEGHKETSLTGNATEPLLASLYVPRNNKLVKIDGNLIINSVLATEKAVAQAKTVVDPDQMGQIPGNGDKETNLAIPGDMFSVLAIVNSGRDLEGLSPRYRAPAGEYHKTQEWFHEGLEGPMFRSGMCTEVFQFDASLASSNGGGLVPAASIVKATKNEIIKSSSSRNMRNRRTLSPHPVQLAGYTPNGSNNDTRKGFGQPSDRSSFSNSTAQKPIIVSVLVDPREGVEGNVDGLLSPKSISRIFVVVLVDSVKYITYSCMLPHKSSVPHIVTV